MTLPKALAESLELKLFTPDVERSTNSKAIVTDNAEEVEPANSFHLKDEQ
jgi:hypothetical protein